jgi:predicted SAM-dependent methyltransferase
MDIRPLESKSKNINFLQVNMMMPLDKKFIDYCDSISSLHAIEHFGLGRYGDPIMYDGYLLGLKNIYEILKKNGKLYLSVPIGPQRIEFNAHRVFSIGFLLSYFKYKYKLDSFSYVDDAGDLHENVKILEEKVSNNYGCNYGCGIFELTKE